VSDLSTWARVLVYAAGAIASAILLYVVVYLAVRTALRAFVAEQKQAAGRQEDLLRTIATSAEYVADVADAWAEAEAERRAHAVGGVGAGKLAAISSEEASEKSPATQGKDHAAAGEGRE
jgi:hypothetical protein